MDILPPLLVQRPVVWRGSSLDDIRGFSPLGRRAIGRRLRSAPGRHGTNRLEAPCDGWKWSDRDSHARGRRAAAYIVVARFAEAVYVLHAFVKKSRKTPSQALDLSAQTVSRANRGAGSR